MTNNNLTQKEVYKLKKYLLDHKISYADFAKILSINVPVLNKFITGVSFPSRRLLEKIFVFTDGQVTPMDFLFRYKQDTSSSLREYVLNAIDSKAISRKELSYQLGITGSALSKKIRGTRPFNDIELRKIMGIIKHQL